ncbi:PLC-like phosphodiesterase [Mycena kentingensis (nom. inval.)]|nr:PLC-like phosphodiesterase [Mycena kentingensis (nom. inval.)]
MAPTHQTLADAALNEILERAAPILGRATTSTPSRLANWMANVPDEMRIVDMSIPGTHDSATWKYSAERQEELMKYMDPLRSHVYFRCQDRSLLQSLEDGIRMFDLRLGYNPGEDTIGFYHGRAMLAAHTTLADVLFGLSNWLLQHPTETILISIQQEAGSHTTYDEKFERILHETLTSPASAPFWLQHRGRLGTLGEARGKMVLLQRFTYELLAGHEEQHEWGIHLGAKRWTHNGPDTELVYSEAPAPRRVAYIQVWTHPTADCRPGRPSRTVQDEFMPRVPPNSGFAATIAKKFAVTTAQLQRAIAADDSDTEEALHLGSASAHANKDEPPCTSNIIALGDQSTGVAGMNERLFEWVKAQPKGSRFGVVLLDFYHSQPGLVEAIIGLAEG